MDRVAFAPLAKPARLQTTPFDVAQLPVAAKSAPETSEPVTGRVACSVRLVAAAGPLFVTVAVYVVLVPVVADEGAVTATARSALAVDTSFTRLE
jgi:hypothetical protein